VQFWDGRAPTLEEQAKGPVENPIEMGATWPDVIAKLKTDAAFVKEFTAVFPDGVNTENVVRAIAEFERSLITPDSRFDQYLRGKVEAITAAEKAGYRLFKKHACATCHVGELLGGQSFELMGRAEDYFRKRSNVGEPDYGRYNVTKIERDRYRFKVPTLRNIALTAPFFHDGSTKDLHEAVRARRPDRKAALAVVLTMVLTIGIPLGTAITGTAAVNRSIGEIATGDPEAYDRAVARIENWRFVVGIKPLEKACYRNTDLAQHERLVEAYRKITGDDFDEFRYEFDNNYVTD